MHKIFAIEFLSQQWIINMSITIFFGCLYFFLSYRVKNQNLQTFLKSSSMIILSMTLAYHIILGSSGSWTLKEDLPLHLCSISAIICCIIFFVKKKQFLFEFLFFAELLVVLSHFQLHKSHYTMTTISFI